MTQVLKEHFPQCFDKNGDLMPHKLQEAILDLAQENNAQANTATQDLENEAAFSLSKESYSLNWLGKSYAKLLRHLPTHTLIAQDSAHNAQPQNANSKNVLIKGDNLEVLKHLKNAYYRKVKMIYIDPPYNTGNGDFIYNDERSFTPQSLAQMANIEIEEASSILNLTLKNSSTHSAWLSFMYPRLYIARQLLRDDGVIFISIDDNEQANLKLLCDEIFGEENFVANFIIQHNPRGRSLDKTLAQTHEYCVCYCKDITAINPFLIAKNENGIAEYNKSDENGLYREMRLMNGNRNFTRNERPNLYFPLYVNVKTNKVATQKSDEFTQEVLPINSFGSEQCWTWSKTKIEKENDLIIARKNSNGEWRIFRKDYLNDTSSFTKTKTLLVDKIFNNENGTETIRKLFGIDVFSTPKPTEMIIYLLNLVMSANSNDIILDFFAGSGTTAQAVMELNAQDNGNREFILVQLDEVIDKSKSKTAYDFCKNELGSENPTIFDITKERIKRASAKIAQNSNLDLGFKIYELRENDFDSQNDALFKEVDKNALLESFRLQDSTPLSVENQTIDLGGYEAIRAGEKLYLLNSGFELKHLQKLISLIDAQKDFVIKEISYLNDAFESARIREIEEGIKSYSNKKGLKILVRARFA